MEELYTLLLQAKPRSLPNESDNALGMGPCDDVYQPPLDNNTTLRQCHFDLTVATARQANTLTFDRFGVLILFFLQIRVILIILLQQIILHHLRIYKQ